MSISVSDLAINGGAKVAPNGLTLRRLFGIDEKQAVMALFDRVTESGSGAMGYSGVEEEAYCKAFCEMHGGGFADGVNSGTNALFVALGATDPRPGAEVIVPPITDPGGAMPVTMLNCIPVSADAEKGSVYNTGPAEIAKVITPRTHAVIVAHISGLPVDMDGILALAKKHSLYVIEDCAQSHLTKYKGRLAGTMGHIAAFSTMFGKQHSSGGQGGIVYTKDEQLYWAARRFADRGKPFGVQSPTSNVVAALNCNMDEIHAAIGRVNLSKLPGFIRRRREIAAKVASALEASCKAVSMVTEREGDEASYWFLIFKLDTSTCKVDKAKFVEALVAEGIPAGPGYPFFPLRMEWAKNRCIRCRSPRTAGDACCDKSYAMPELPNAMQADHEHFRLTIHEDWTQNDVDLLIQAVTKVEAAYCS